MLLFCVTQICVVSNLFVDATIGTTKTALRTDNHEHDDGTNDHEHLKKHLERYCYDCSGRYYATEDVDY